MTSKPAQENEEAPAHKSQSFQGPPPVDVGGQWAVGILWHTTGTPPHCRGKGAGRTLRYTAVL